MRVGAFERDLVDPTRRQGREDMLVLPPLVAERRLPFDIGRDAVAVADVYGGLADEAVDRAVQRGDAPAGDLVEIDVESGLVELDHVDADRLELARLFVQQNG